MTPKSVLITGAAGFIGSHLTEHCLALDWHVTAVDSCSNYYDARLKRANIARAQSHPNCVFVDQDLLALDLPSLIAGVRMVFHLAGQPGVRASWADFPSYCRTNVEVTQRLLHAAVHGSLERFVLASSSSVYGDAEALPTREDVAPRPVSPYGVTKLAAEHLAEVYWRSFGLPTVRLRYFTVYGPRQRPDMAFNRLIAQTLAREPFEVFGDGHQTRDFTFVGDAVAATVAAGQRGMPGAAYNIGGGSRRSMNSVLESLSEILGTSVERTYRERQIGDARHTAADIAQAQRDFGFTPSPDFDAGLRAQVEWQRGTRQPPLLTASDSA